MSLQSQNPIGSPGAWERSVKLVKDNLSTVLIIVLGYAVYFLLNWVKELVDERHREDKEYMIFFRDQYNETNKYINYNNSRYSNEKTISYPDSAASTNRKP